jgi:hypothetical protein
MGGSAIAIEAIKDSASRNSGPAYGSSTPVRTTADANHYTPTYAPLPTFDQTPAERTVQDQGLSALYESMANQFAPISQQIHSMDQFYQQPAQQAPAQIFQSPALNYRPDMSGIRANLGRVQPSVAELNRRAAEEAARQAAAQAAWDAEHPQPTYPYGGGD